MMCSMRLQKIMEVTVVLALLKPLPPILPSLQSPLGEPISPPISMRVSLGSPCYLHAAASFKLPLLAPSPLSTCRSSTSMT